MGAGFSASIRATGGNGTCPGVDAGDPNWKAGSCLGFYGQPHNRSVTFIFFFFFFTKACLDTANGLFICQLGRTEGNLRFNGFLVNNQKRSGRESFPRGRLMFPRGAENY